jgi:hypothetical protein
MLKIWFKAAKIVNNPDDKIKSREILIQSEPEMIHAVPKIILEILDEKFFFLKNVNLKFYSHKVFWVEIKIGRASLLVV